MLTKSIEVMSYCKASAGRAGLGVIFEDTNHPRHDGENIYLPRITKDTTEDQLLEYMSSTDHEVGHDRFSCFEVLAEKNLDTNTSILGFIWNVLEDSRVNNIEAREYYGFKQLWDQVTPKILDNINYGMMSKPKTELGSLTASLIKWETATSFNVFPACAVSGKLFVTDPATDAILLPFSVRLYDISFILDKRRGSEASYNLARDIFKSLGGDPDAEEEAAKKSSKGSGEASESDGESDEADGEGEAGSGDEESDEPKEGKAKRSDKWEIIKRDLKEGCDEFLVTKHGTRMSHTGINSHIPPTGSGWWTMTPAELFSVVDFPKKTVQNCHEYVLNLGSRDVPVFIGKFNDRVRGKAVAPENFADQVRRLIQVRARCRREYGLKKGKLDSSRLSRITINAPGFNERIFKRKITDDTLNAAVYVLVDFSGSMSGDKALHACEATMLLAHVFDVLKVPLEIVGFTDSLPGSVNHPPCMFILKGFDTQHINSETLLSHYAAASSFMAGNPDGENILWSYQRLLKRKEKKRCLIVLSDGQPAASRHECGIAAFTKQVIEEIEQAKHVDIYGLGILDDSVKQYYKQHSVIDNVAEIPIKLLDLIEHKLLD